MIRLRNSGRGLTLAAAALLAACAGTQQPPLAFEIKDATVMARDFSVCRGYAAQVRQRLSIRSIATAGGKSGLASAPGAAVNPLVPAVAALGGAAGEALQELNLLGQTERHLVVACMRRKGDASHAYFILDPSN